MKDPDWLLGSVPREVQLEALRRSYGGFWSRNSAEGDGKPVQFRNGPDTGWGHFLEMRLGKTYTAMNEFELFARDHGFKNIVVICPNSFKWGWALEASRSGISVPWIVFESKAHGEAMQEAKKAHGRFGVSMNYEAIRSEKAQSFLEANVGNETMLVVDESIRIKDHTSLQSKAVREIALKAGVVRLLSGLPMTQGPHDLYAQLRAARRLNGLNFYAFRNRFCKMGGFKAKKVVGTKNEEKLKVLLDSCSFIAKKKDWGVQAGAEYYIENLPVPNDLKKYYDQMNNELVVALENGIEISADMVITKMTKLAQISSGFIYDEGQIHTLMDPRKTPKMARLLDVLQETDEKIIVVYNYKASGDALLECLSAYSPACIRSQDWMKKNGKDAESEKKKFNNDSACRVMVVQTLAGKYGHDLAGTEGDRCAKMIFYENTYSLDDRIQIEMRNTMAFQTWANEYFDFVSTPVEKLAVVALEKKTDVAETILGEFRNRGVSGETAYKTKSK